MNTTVWVVDDDEGILEVIQILFEEEGIKGEYISNPQHLDRFLSSKKQPKLILLDVFMSGSDGVEIAHKLKTDPNTSSIPIVLMTADMEISKKILHSKAEEYLTKPFDIDELLQIVQKYTT